MASFTKFEFHTVADIRFGAGCLAELPALLLSKFKAKKVLLVTDQGLRRAGIIDSLLANLAAAKIDVQVFDQVIADPPESVILAAADKAKGVDLIIGMGGGSSMDTAKLAAVVCMDQQALHTMYGVDKVLSSRKPLIQIPTTAGTGSEVTPISVVTTGESTKAGVVSGVLYADMALLDPELLLALPAHITAETGIDAMVHAIEAYTSKIKKNPMSDTLAIKALSLLAAHLPKAYDDGANVEHRSATMLGAMLAGQAFANAPVAGVHALAYPLGGNYHLAHGLSNALMLPHVLRYNLDGAAALYAELADVLINDCTGSTEEKATRFIEYMTTLCAKTGLNKRLRDVGIPRDGLQELAEQAMLQTRLLQNNPKDINLADALAMYQQAW
ncbi:MAG: alcohol dehydrogenase [Paraglaciecola sp.]